MSGICGVWRIGNPKGTSATIAYINAGLKIDGAETCSSQTDDWAGVGVSARFQEQQTYGDQRVLLACDAELINYGQLTKMVDTRGEPLVPPNPARVLAALYERYGTRFVEELRGGFAIVLWDRIERRLLAVVDGFGIKRLAYYKDEKGILIASRVDALARTGEVPTDVNPRAIASTLNFSCNLGPDTVFKSVLRLPPGTLLVAATQGQAQLKKYWDMKYGMGRDFHEGRLSHELESVVEQSVAAYCGDSSFSTLGAFLSGGTDSSTVVGMMTRAAGGPVNAFSIGFEEQPFNELGYAELAARKFKSKHFMYLVRADDCFEALPAILRAFDEPFGNSSAIPTYFCARLAAQQGVRVLLAGDGGDELFGGNERYAADKLFEVYHRLPGFVRKGLLEPILRIAPVKGRAMKRARGYVRRANMRGVGRMLSFQFLYTHAMEAVFESDFLQALGEYHVADVPEFHYKNAPARDHLDRLLYVDMKITLADNDLPKVTQASELAGVRTRFPLLDRTVAEFAGRVPPHLKVKGFNKRYLFKRAFRELLPPEIIQKKKHGFGIPVATWLKTDRRMRELVRDTLFSSRALGRGYFRRAFIEDLFQKHQSDTSTYYGDTLWTFLALELWHQRVVDESARVIV